MERFLPNFFIFMVILWVMGVYYTHDIIVKINHEQTFHIHLQRLRGQLDMLVHRLKNTSNHTI